MPLFLCFFSGCARTEKKAGEVIIWHWMTDRQAAFEKLATKYKQETGISVKFELFAPSEVYSSKIKAAAQTNTLPDIFGILAEARDFAGFIKAGFIADLTTYMSENGWKDSFFQKALSMNEFLPENQYGVKPGIYGVPIDVTNIQMLYNKSLFKKAGLNPENPPQNWDEFISAGKKLRDSGIQVLIGGFGETWMLDCLASNFSWNILGKDKVIATIKGEVPYTDPDWISVFKLFQTLYEEKLIATGSINMVNKVAEQNFANEKAAMALNGSWCVNVYSSMNPSLDYDVMLPPKVSDKFPITIWGGAGSSFMINAKSPVKEEAVIFLKWFTDTDQQVFLCETIKNLPSNKNSAKKISPILAKFAEKMDIVVHPSQLPVTEYSNVVEAFDKGLQSIIIGEKTPEQIAEYVQQVKEREMKRSKPRF
jgi:ABC-type glycerol-3-phosphate transport system substrate-binding protein